MALDFKLLHYRPAAIPCASSLNGRPGIGITQTFVQIGGRKSQRLMTVSADDLHATQFGSLASWAVSRFTVAMRIACNLRTLFSNLFVLFVAVVSRPACSISDNRSRW